MTARPGIRSSGDIAKALAAGADAVMMGRIFASVTESAGAVIRVGDIDYKSYEGAEYGTIELAQAPLPANLHQTAKQFCERMSHRSEGISGLIRHTGPVGLLLEQILRSLSAALAFVGATNLSEFRERAVFQRVSPATQRHGDSHSLDVITRCDRLWGGEG